VKSIDPIRVSGEVSSDHARSSRLDWLETNGTGGCAMGTDANGGLP
jgi:hypothetical protein